MTVVETPVAVPTATVESAPPATPAVESKQAAPLTRRQRRMSTQPTPVIPQAGPEVLSVLSTASIAVPATASVPVQTGAQPVVAPVGVSEPVAEAEPVSEPAQEPLATASTDEEPVDEFVAAARLFSFTGETPVQSSDEELVAERIPQPDEPEQPAEDVNKAPRSRRATRSSLKRMAAASASFGVIMAVGLLAVSTTMPAEAVAAVDAQFTGVAPLQQAGDVSASSSDEIQAYVAPGDAAAVAGDLDRSANYSTATLVEMAGTTGISNVSSAVYTNNTQCDVQWPFAVGVPISYGFGPRPGEFHEGVDFTPGSGAHVQAIADGTVRIAQEGYQGYGVAVIIDHVIDGQHVASLYGHMQYGSLQVHAGEKVKVGQYIGRTGNTGYSFGAHTHVEIRQNGVTPIDPLPWLRSHNKC